MVGTKEGTLEILDIGAGESVSSIEAHKGAVWAVSPLPDNSGLVSGSADHEAKFWEWEVRSIISLSEPKDLKKRRKIRKEGGKRKRRKEKKRKERNIKKERKRMENDGNNGKECCHGMTLTSFFFACHQFESCPVTWWQAAAYSFPLVPYWKGWGSCGSDISAS